MRPDPSNRIGRMRAVLVEVLTDEGITGLGEAWVPRARERGGSPEVTKAIIDGFKHKLLKKDPFNVTRIHRTLRLGGGHWGPQTLRNQGRSAVEIALWDIIGKACNKPLHKIWGGAYRRKIQYYADVPRDSLEIMKQQASDYLRAGWKTLFIKVGYEPENDLAAVKVLREAVDDGGYKGVEIRVDANQQWSPGRAINILKKMSKYGLEYAEQPVTAYNLNAMKRVMGAVDVPILSHESSWTHWQVLDVIKEGAADAIQTDPRFDDGLRGARLSAGMCETAGLPIILHTTGEMGIATAAFMHVVASYPNFLHANQTVYNYLTDDVIKGGLMKFEEDCLRLPEKPGLGVELDQEKVRKYHELYVKEKGIVDRGEWVSPEVALGLPPRGLSQQVNEGDVDHWHDYGTPRW